MYIKSGQMTQIQKTYKGFLIVETMQEGGASTAIAYLDGKPVFGTFSHLDTLTAYEKMIQKINSKKLFSYK